MRIIDEDIESSIEQEKVLRAEVAKHSWANIKGLTKVEALATHDKNIAGFNDIKQDIRSYNVLGAELTIAIVGTLLWGFGG